MADAEPPDGEIPLTYASGPSEPRCLADEPGTWAQVTIDAQPEVVWQIVSDIDAPAAFSDEFVGASWVDGGPHLGASFLGRNRHPAIGEWEVASFVDVYDEGRAFGWATVDAADPGSRWRFTLEPDGAGTALRFSVSIGPGPSGITMAITAMPDKEPRILQRRLAEHHANMVRTVEGIKHLAETNP